MSTREELLENEANRWSSMDTKQLITRLNKITNPHKLEVFLEFARYRSMHRELLERGLQRCEHLGFYTTQVVGTERFRVRPISSIPFVQRNRLIDETNRFLEPKPSGATMVDEAKEIGCSLYKRKLKIRRKR